MRVLYNKRPKSPIGYMGGKRIAAPMLFEYIPEGTKQVVSPFFGGGGFEFCLIEEGIDVLGFDADGWLIAFWHYYFEEYTLLEKEIKALACNMYDRAQLHEIKEQLRCIEADAITIADVARWYIVFKRSFNNFGLSRKSGFSETGQRKSCAIHKMAFSNSLFTGRGVLTLQQSEWQKVLAENKDAFLFCDPPYYNKEHYYYYSDTHGFDHEALAIALQSHKGGFVLCYSDHEYISKLYSWASVESKEWYYCSGISNGSLTVGKELIITDG